MSSSKPSNNYSPELRERAIRMVAEVRGEYTSDWAAAQSVADKLGIGTPQTVLNWVRKAQVDAGQRPGVTSAEAAELRRLRAEVKQLRLANDILKTASAFSPRRSSTADSADRGVHRRSRRPVRGRADLPGAQCARHPDRPVHLLRRPSAGTLTVEAAR
jgi:transposase